MNLPAFCIQRPAFTIVISLVMTIMGIMSFTHLPLRWIPNINMPSITINTTYPGANARLVERDITKTIEESLSGINGIENLTSKSRQNESNINLTFKLGTNLDAAVEDVRTAVERVKRSLPKDAENPLVLKADPNNMPLLFITFSHEQLSARELSDYIDKYIVPVFETIDGVGSLQVYGKQISAVHIWLDPQKMASHNVTVDEITGPLKLQNASTPSGQIRSRERIYNVLADTSLKNIKEFNNLIIRDENNQLVRLQDVGKARLDAENSDVAFRINGKPAIAIGVIPQSNSNPLDVETNIKNRFAELKKTLPPGLNADIGFNQADFIRASIKSVYESFFEAVMFVGLVILAFLCSFRATAIPIITIPVCMISTFAILYFFHFSINTITLMAFVLAIGLVVDDAIVMLENIERHIKTGLSPYQAALIGSREMIFPIIAMTLTLTAVYAPIAFTPGLLGVLFREFTFSLAGAVIISGIVALTLSPMMCARVLKKEANISRYAVWLKRTLDYLQAKYRLLLHFAIRKRLWVVLLLLLIAALGGIIYKFTPAELAPTEDMGEIYAYIAAPRSASFQYTDNYVKQLETIYNTYPDVQMFISTAGSFSQNKAFQFLKLKPIKARSQTVSNLITELTQKASILPGVSVNVFPPSPPLAEFAGSDNGDSLGLVLMTTNDYKRLQEVSSQLVAQIKKNPLFAHVDNNLKWDSEQFKIDIDRNKAADLKVSLENITNTISTLLAGKIVGKRDDANIIVQMQKSSASNPDVFQELYVRNDNGLQLPLSSLLTIKEGTTPEIFHHQDRLRSDTIFVTLAPKANLAKAIQVLQSIAKNNLPKDIKYSFSGEAKSFLESNGQTLITFFLALLFIYLVLTAQFESFIDPLIILLTVPFALVGAIATLKVFGGSLNIYSNIGLITLIGLVAKHGILITEFANRLRLSGNSIEEAVMRAAELRLRPILMTTSAMVLGALPLALASGPGAESRQQIGLVITGGLLFGTFFSLIVIPIMYTYLSPWRKTLGLRQLDIGPNNATTL